ncbi:hypothetical protein FRB90_005637 [Tulasnella sp. 427]|nr:hypothetical protein FRB90_005637 [Tulasnella sp. 427]
MATPMPSRPPSPPPRNRRPRASLPTRETFDFTCPPNPWPTLGGSVAWSKAAPPPGPSNYHQQQPQPHPGNNPQWTAPATAAGPSSAQHQPQGYQEWPAQGGHYRPEIMLSLPSTVVNEGLGLPGADTGLPTVLNNLDIGGPPSHQMYNVHPQPHSVGYETVHYAAPAAAPQAPTLHAAPQTMLDPQHVQLSLADARSTMNVLSHTIEYAASGGAVVEPQHVAGGHSDFSEGVWGDMFNQEFAAFPSVQVIPSVNSMDFAITDMSDVQLNFDQFAQSAMFDQPGAASNGGMAMEDESGDAMLADQFGLDLASQVVHDNWPAQTQQPAGNSGFHPGIFTAKGQINFAAPASAVPSPTEATSYYSPAAISPNGGFDAGEPSPPPYEPGPAEGAGRYLPPTSKPDAYYVAPASRPVEDPRTLDPNLLSYGAQGSTKAPLLAPARLRVYAAPPPSGVLERKAPVDAIPDGPPEIPRASKPVLKHLPGASGAGGGRRVTSISATLPPVPNLTSSH